MITNMISPSIGVEIQGISESGFTDPDIASTTSELLARHGVVVFPRAHISDADLVAFSECSEMWW